MGKKSTMLEDALTLAGLRKEFKDFRKNSAKAAIELYYGEETARKVLEISITNKSTADEIKAAEQKITQIMKAAKEAFNWDDAAWDDIPAELA